MATRGERPKVLKLQSITTADILRKLKQVTDKGGDNTEFFYLYVSTAGKERKKRQQRAQLLPQGQQQLCFPPQAEEDPVEDDEIIDSDEEDDEDTDDQDDDRDDQDDDRDVQDDRMDSQDNRTYSQDDQTGANVSFGSQPSLSSPLSPLLSKDKARQEAMNHVHKVILPSLLGQDGWQKVYDKDTKLTYRALYFNIIEQIRTEDEPTFVQRVGQIRHKIAHEAKTLMKDRGVNFKINSLLSKPFLYNEKALEERATQTQPPGLKQRTLDDYQ